MSARADDFYNPRTTFGEVGILEMPSARNAADGELSLTVGDLKDEQRFNLGFQVLPWLGASFRYSHVPSFLGLKDYYDRSFGLKIRLQEERRYLPEISLGMRDLLGTGIYSGEYLVASKRIWDVDFSLGIGWGRFAQSNALPNPIAQIIPSFKTRAALSTDATVNFGQLFHGPRIGIFGGAVWHTPIDNLEVLIEYSSDRYASEVSYGTISIKSPINVGIVYRAFDRAAISAGWMYGTTYGLTLSLSADPTTASIPQKIGAEIPAPSVRPPNQQIEALTTLFRHTAPEGAYAFAGPWVQLPNIAPSSDSPTIASALMSAADNIRDVDITGRTLIVYARLTQSASRQCDRYAKVVSSIAPSLLTIALSDLDDPSGQVAICPISHRSSLAIGDSEAAVATTLTDGSDFPSAELDPASTVRKIRTDVSAQSIDLEALSVTPDAVWLYFSNRHYNSESEAAGRIARILMSDAPPSVEIFHIVSVHNGMAQRDFQIGRSALERATLSYGTPAEMAGAVSLNTPPLSNPPLERAWDYSYPRYRWSIGPALREGFFDPARPVQVQILAIADASVDLTPQWTLEGRADANIFNTYELNQLSDSLLPHVRSDFAQYFRHGINGISNLDARYLTRVSRDTYFEAKIGYLEDMFAGGGVQILWRPEGERFSIGADLYQVWQRKFDRLFGLQSYHVLTGHASIYYASPWYGLNFAVHAGRFLAGDYGATFEVTRRFSTGVEIGAFATVTNVSSTRFGEGAFDKGIIVHIPLEWALPFFTQSSYDLRLRSLTRDGGVRLDNDDSLYQETLPSSYGEAVEHVDEIVAP